MATAKKQKVAVKRFCTIDDWDTLLKNIAKDTKNPNESYRYLKDHEKESRDWYFEGDHDEYPWAFLQK